MADMVVGYILLGIVGVVFVGGALTALILKLTWGRKVRYPKGRKNSFKYNEFEATLIVDDSVKIEGNDFIVEDKKMDKTILAKMCAMSMESFNHTAKTYGPQQLRKNKKLKECVFVFVPEDKYYDMMMEQYYTKVPSAGFSDKLSYNMGSKEGPYVCYMQIKYMWEVYTTGYLTVHEYTHCYSDYVANNWDTSHELWKFRAVNGKTLQYIAVDRIKTKLELDKKLQS